VGREKVCNKVHKKIRKKRVPEGDRNFFRV
jgi:hypothetical protein